MTSPPPDPGVPARVFFDPTRGFWTIPFPVAWKIGGMILVEQVLTERFAAKKKGWRPWRWVRVHSRLVKNRVPVLIAAQIADIGTTNAGISRFGKPRPTRLWGPRRSRPDLWTTLTLVCAGHMPTRSWETLPADPIGTFDEQETVVFLDGTVPVNES